LKDFFSRGYDEERPNNWLKFEIYANCLDPGRDAWMVDKLLSIREYIKRIFARYCSKLSSSQGPSRRLATRHGDG